MLGFIAAAGSKILLVDSPFLAVVFAAGVSSKQPLPHSAAVMLYLAVYSSLVPVCQQPLVPLSALLAILV